MRRLGLLAPLLLSLMACTGRSSSPPGSTAGGDGPGEVGASSPTPTPVEGSTPPPAGPDPGANGPVCGDKTCAADEQCISYFGIAGPAGPKFQECGIPCQQGGPNGGCPEGKRCQTIADGPGPVCR